MLSMPVMFRNTCTLGYVSDKMSQKTSLEAAVASILQTPTGRGLTPFAIERRKL